MAIGLAALGARTLGGVMGSDLETIILASSVLYELLGPGCAKLALYLSKSYSTKLEDLAVVQETTETGEQKSDAELLIERIQKIRAELPARPHEDMSEEEAAFMEAAEEQRLAADAGAETSSVSEEVKAMQYDLIAGWSGRGARRWGSAPSCCAWR